MFLTLFVQPIYNCFIFILGLVPGGDVGVAIILLTLLVRLVFYPIFMSSIRTQMAMQAIQPELAEINEKYKDDSVEKARRTADLFKRHKVRPFSLIIASIIQVVIFLALSYAFFRLGLPNIRTDLLYPFVHAPLAVNENFLGVLNLVTAHHVILTVIVVALQYAAVRLSLERTAGALAHLPPERAKAQLLQQRMMLYLLPAMMAFFGYTFPAAVGIYLAVSSVVSIGQELLLRRRPL
jgi:YidC/Oxa1 family membrane protein insertase